MCTLSKVTAGAALSVGILRLNLGLNQVCNAAVSCALSCALMRSTRDATHAARNARTRELNEPFATYGAFVSILIPSLL